MILQELKNLKDIKPQQDWKESERALLLSQIKGQQAAVSEHRSFFATVKTFSNVFLPNKMLKLVAEPIGVMAMVAAAVFGTGILGVNASKGSVPGDMLYSVKRTSEKVQVGLTSTGEKKAKLHVEFAAERVKEVDKIVKQNKTASETNELVKIATDGLKEELSKAKEQMEQAKENPVDAQAVVDAAKEVDKKAEELSVEIADKKDDVAKAISETGDTAVLKTMDEAAKEATVTSIKAVEVIIEKHQDGTVVQSEGELISAIGDKITKVEDQIKAANVEVTKAEATIKADATAPVTPATTGTVKPETTPSTVPGTSTTPTTPTTPTATVPATGTTTAIEDMKAIPVQATAALTEAKTLLNQGDLTSALEKVIQSTELTAQAVTAAQALPTATPATTPTVPAPTTTPAPATTTTTVPTTQTTTTTPTTTSTVK